MGCHENITASRFPAQDEYLGMRTDVVFHYDALKRLGGTVVRSDREEPGEMIIRLDDGRYVRAVECQYRLPYAAAAALDAEAVIAAALAHRAADAALAAHLDPGRSRWNAPAEAEITREWRRRRLELTEEVSRTRIALLEAAVKK
jgi:hypothetical protein